MLHLMRRRPAPVPQPWAPHEADRVWIKGTTAVHEVVFTYEDRALCRNLDHPLSRTDVPASWLRPVDPELRPRPPVRAARGWWR